MGLSHAEEQAELTSQSLRDSPGSVIYDFWEDAGAESKAISWDITSLTEVPGQVLAILLPIQFPANTWEVAEDGSSARVPERTGGVPGSWL